MIRAARMICAHAHYNTSSVRLRLPPSPQGEGMRAAKRLPLEGKLSEAAQRGAKTDEVSMAAAPPNHGAPTAREIMQHGTRC